MSSRRVDGARALHASRGATLVAIGNFDGVHRGHQHVLGSAVALARKQGLMPLVLTFDPHPTEVLGQGRRAVLTAIDRKIELVCRMAPELRVVVEPFTMDLARLSPREFAEDLLVQQLGASVVLVGQNFRFGHRRMGDLATLEILGRELGFEARAENLHGDSAGTYSSSRIRDAIKSGDLVAAERMLGRPHSVAGSVVQGDQRGRTIGVPTANLAGFDELLPLEGVHAVLVDRIDQNGIASKLGRGVANIGHRPTVGSGFSVEVHVFDFAGDLYGERLRVHFVERLRDERKFEDLDRLVAQIRRDIAAAREATALRAADPAAGEAWH